MTDIDRLRELTRTELRRVCEEFKSERDAAKQTAMRAVEERNIAIAEATQLRDRLAATERERDELNEEDDWHLRLHDHLAAKLSAVESERDALRAERDELIHDIERHIAIASREAEARIQAERERDAAIRALQTHKGEQ